MTMVRHETGKYVHNRAGVGESGIDMFRLGSRGNGEVVLLVVLVVRSGSSSDDTSCL